MITKMTGILSRVLDEECRLQIGPIEYQILIPEATRRQIQLRTGQEITLHISEYLEGNSAGSRFIPRQLGFLTEADLEFFDLFCTVEKIGAKKALKAMARPVREIANAINRQDTKWLSTLPGIGNTTAEQIITTLKRKVAPFLSAPAVETTDEPVPGTEPKSNNRRKTTVPESTEHVEPELSGQIIEDLYQALMGFGHTPVEARSKLDNLLKSGKKFTTMQEALIMIYNRG